MRVKLCLFGLALCGIALIFVPKVSAQFPHDSQGLQLWRQSVQLFAIPLILILIGLRPSLAARSLTIFWASWIVGASLWLLFNAAPPLTYYGNLYVILCLNLAGGSILFSFMPSRPKKKKQKNKTRRNQVRGLARTEESQTENESG